MLKRDGYLVCLLLALQLGFGGTALSAEEPLEKIQRAIEAGITYDEPGLAVAISVNDVVLVHHAAGLANVELQSPITEKTVFHSASLSKQFTAFAVMSLIEAKRLNLSTSVQDVFPELATPFDQVTVHHLLTHTSGLREFGTLASMAGWLSDDIRTQAQMWRLITRQTALNFKPGARVEYSNTGYFLLAKIVEQIAGQSLEDVLRESVFAPLKMARTHIVTDRNRLNPNRADSYLVSGTGVRKAVYVNEMIGSTGLQTNVIDLVRWAQFLNHQEALNSQVSHLMQQRHSALNGDDAVFANGQERRTYRGLDTWSHGGQDAGFRSFLIRIPEANFALSILSNRNDTDTAALAFQLIDLYFELPADSLKQKTPPTDDLAPFAGDYELYPGTIMSFRVDQGHLLLSMLGDTTQTALPRIGKHEFQLSVKPDRRIEFQRSTEAVTGFDFIVGQHGRIPAQRVNLKPFDASKVGLTEYVGSYYSAELAAEYTLLVRDGMLVAQHARLPDMRLQIFQSDTFWSNGSLPKVRFVRDSQGGIVGFTASGPLAEGVLFVRQADTDYAIRQSHDHVFGGNGGD